MTADDRGATVPEARAPNIVWVDENGCSCTTGPYQGFQRNPIDPACPKHGEPLTHGDGDCEVVRPDGSSYVIKEPAATVPVAHIDAVADVVAYIRDQYPRIPIDADSADVAEAVLTDPRTLDALAWAVTRTPEGRDKVLAALVETGTLTEDSLPASQEWDSLDAVLRGDAGRMVGYRRLVTEWTEVEP